MQKMLRLYFMKGNTRMDSRQKDILMSAWQAFSAYGFRKTSMDDIARGAGISRPGLYLHYKNKVDIFRSLAQFYYDGSVVDFAEALTQDGPVGEILGEALVAKSGEIVASMLTSPHGHELLDTNQTNAADVAEAGEARLAEILTNWLNEQAAAGRITLPAPADDVARISLASVKNLMQVADSHEGFTRDVRTLGRLIGDGLS